MKLLRRASGWLLAASLMLVACQKNDSIGPEPAEPVDSTKSAVAVDGSAEPARAEAGTSAPGPLVPYASGKAPAGGDIPSPDADEPAPNKVSAQTPPDGAVKAKGEKSKSGKVKLLEAGAEPRKELRLKAKVGQKDALRMTMAMSVDMNMAGQAQPKSSLPPMVMDMSMKVTETRPNGDIRYEFSLTNTAVRAAPGTDPRVAKVLEEALGQLKGLSGHAVVSDRGINREAKIDLGDKANAQTQQVMQGMEQAMQQIGAPLPKEAVGVGARWRYATTIVQQGIKVKQRATYDLKAIDGDKLTLGVKIEQRAPKQRVSAPGGSVDLLELHAGGGGSVQMMLSKLAPDTSDMNILSKVVMGMPKGQKMSVNTTMKIDIAALKP